MTTSTMRNVGLFALSALVSLGVIAGYDIACIYPDQAIRDPFSLRALMTLTYGDMYEGSGIETPIVVRLAHYHTLCQSMCLSYSNPDVKDPFTMEDSLFTVPEYGQNAYSINMCNAQCYAHVYEDHLDFMERAIVSFEEEWGIVTTEPSTRLDIKDAMNLYDQTGNLAMLNNILVGEDFHPYTVGHLMGFKVKEHMVVDGWNSEGDMTYDRETGMEVPCTGSCRRYQDTTGYEPMPDPRIHTDLSDDSTKYECTGLCTKWQPLQEGDDIGSLKRQEFIVPHIGSKAKWYLREPTLTLADPEIDYYEESLLVIDRLRTTTTDIFKGDAVEYMDNKRYVRRIMQTEILKYKNQGIYSFEEHLMYLLGLSTSEYDGLLQGWHEKRHHDLVRPTTVIKHWDSDDLLTYGGEITNGGPVQINARDFEAFIRVMPHPEFPSGSSCLCTTYYEFTDLYTMQMFNDTLTDVTYENRGRSYTVPNLETVRNICGQSRLWGGIHYTAAIRAGEEICEGLGQLGLQYVDEIKGGATFEGDNFWYAGDTLGTCNDM